MSSVPVAVLPDPAALQRGEDFCRSAADVAVPVTELLVRYVDALHACMHAMSDEFQTAILVEIEQANPPALLAPGLRCMQALKSTNAGHAAAGRTQALLLSRGQMLRDARMQK